MIGVTPKRFKLSVVRELRRRGFTAIDMDEPGWFYLGPDGQQLWHEDKLREAMGGHGGEHLFVSGCAENQVKFYPDFTHIILLTAPADVKRERIMSRTDNPYGKRPEEWTQVLEHLGWVEPLLRKRATHEIVTTMPLDQVFATVLAIVS